MTSGWGQGGEDPWWRPEHSAHPYQTPGPSQQWGNGYLPQDAYLRYAPPPPSGRKRQLTIAALILVPVLVVAGLLITLVVKHSQSADAGGPLDGQLRNTYPTTPSPGWTLHAADIAPGAAFVLPDSIAYTYQTPGVIDLGNLVVTAAVSQNSGDTATLVGIDPAKGAVRWTNSDLGERPVCASKLIDGLLACMGGGSAAMVSFLRPDDGRIDHQLDVRGDHPSALLVHGSDLYTVGYQSMSKGTIDDLTKSWSRTYPVDSDSGRCSGSGDSHYFGVDDHAVFYGSDTGVKVADAGDGHLFTDTELQGVQLFGSSGFAGRACARGSQDVSVQLVGPDGSPRTLDTAGWVAEPWLVKDRAKIPVVAGNDAYDPASGKKVWSIPGRSEHSGVDSMKIIGGVLLAHSWEEQHGNGPLTGYDVNTGKELWTSSSETSELPISDGERVMVRDGYTSDTRDKLTAIDVATGRQVWTLRADGQVDTVGAGFVATKGDTITFYPPTGGPSVSPAIGATDPAPAKSGNGGPITKCGKRPELKPVEYRAENGGLTVKMEFKATCPGGDIISGNHFRIAIRDGDSLIASGYFDFSTDPIVLGGSDSPPTTVDLTFGDGSVWRLPNTLGDRGSGAGVVTSSKSSGNEIVDCEEEGGGVGPSSTDQQPHAPSGPQLAAGDAPCSDGDALAALRVQVDSDRPYVQSDLADRWAAQLSAKRPGLVATEVDGRVVTWTPCEILRQHLRMRLQYPEVRLVWSDEWRTFDLEGWWVTIAGLTFGDPDAANGWCDQRSIAVDQCFAKIISNSRDSSGTTKYRR